MKDHFGNSAARVQTFERVENVFNLDGRENLMKAVVARVWKTVALTLTLRSCSDLGPRSKFSSLQGIKASTFPSIFPIAMESGIYPC
jgi:hypothetical protein